ncbi:MAG TPA: glycosyltransferase, partial [Acidimicrobiales bacterium]|nr:glycosyltransferase [Acidimicrobiales bacterium]
MSGTSPVAVPVVIDAQPLTSVAAGGGIASYIRNLLQTLAGRDDVALTALCTAGAVLPEGVARMPISRVGRRGRVQVIEHAVRLPVEARRGRPASSVFHTASFHAPFGVRAPKVQTLFDVIPLVFDAPDLARLRARWKRFGPRYRDAAAVVAISRHAANEGIRLLGLDPARVHVAHLGVDGSFCVGAAAEDEGAPYVLVVSEYSARKGFAEAFAVMDELVEAGF